MASKEVNVREWECDGCGNATRADTNSRDLPEGWTSDTTMFDSGHAGEYSKGLDFCPECSKDPEAAARRWKANMGQ